MGKKAILILAVSALSFLSLMSVNAQTQVNLALTATVSTSFVSSWEKLSAVNDGNEPKNSKTKGTGAYGNWEGEENYKKYNWVQYEWALAQKITSTAVYWWDDGGGIDQPTDAYIEYWTGNEWLNAGKIGTSLDQFNNLTVDLWTNKIRINMVSLMATGILEWQVFGTESGPCEATALTSYITISNGEKQQTNVANIVKGDSVKFSVSPEDEGVWFWTGPDGFTLSERELKLTDVNESQSGTYIVTFLNNCGAYSKLNFYLTVSSSNIGDSYNWPSYSPTLNYNFRNEFPVLDMPTKDLDDCSGVVGTQSSGWWTFKWGAKANSVVTEAAITPMLERMNEDFAYFRDTMGWPPDKRAKNGYRSAIYLYGSGLCTDNASNTALGGWQSAVDHDGESWPMVLLSYYPVYSFDPKCKYSDKSSQMGAVVHEGIHSVLADLPGCKNAAWFHEGGNTWLQQEAESRRTGDYSSMGFLNASPYIAPFMPIECYSGWLQDDSFGGPSAEGVNKYNSSGAQLCTWRNLLGGNQYGNTFPTFLGQALGVGSVPWIWRHCESRVLEGMADSLGESQTRRLIMEYRAKQTLIDMGEWTGAIKKLLNANFKSTIKSEWNPTWLNPEKWVATPYAKTTTDSTGVLTPEYRTTPGWSGANQIPLYVNGDTVVVNFQPIGENMTCQLCYRTKEGETVYGQPVFGGDCVLRLDLKPANNVVFAVICNTNYKYEGEATRKAHYDYRLKLVKGVERAASIYVKWYEWTKELDDIISTESSNAINYNDIKVFPNPIDSDRNVINIEFNKRLKEPVDLEIRNIQGRLFYKNSVSNNIEIDTSGLPGRGIYFLTATSTTNKYTYKLILN